MDPEEFRAAMARHASGVVVVSTVDAGGFRGLTASSFTSVSLDPPLLLVCLDTLSATRDAVVTVRRFNVSLLARNQEFVADRFAGRAPLVDPAWRAVPHRVGANGIAVVEGCVAWFECDLEQLHAAGDHDIAVGRVLRAEAAGGDPLVHWDRAFWSLCR